MHPRCNFLLTIFFLVQSVQFYSTSVIALALIRSPTTGACTCMDYWDCITSDGNVYSYCGISDTQVCCFHTRINKINTNSSAETIAIVSSPAGNEDPPTTTDNDFVYVSSTLPTTFVTTSSSSDSSTLQDVDYFYSLESGDGDLKQIITTERSPPEVCGKQAVNWKLDSKAEFREWPWHVALLEVTEDVYICGGSLISHDKVVTAAHCVKSHVRPDAPKLKVRVGEYDITTNSEGDPYFEVLVEKIVMHPNFNNATLANDIAILMLRSPLNYSMNIRPICLPSHITDDDDDGLTTSNGQKIGSFEQCVVTGWGRASENSPFSVLLKEIVVPLWNHFECQEKLRKNFGNSYNLPETAICAGERDHDACDGDGGGPLTCFRKGQWELVGIVSFGIGCGRMDNPGVYTNVLQYVQWLDAFN